MTFTDDEIDYLTSVKCNRIVFYHNKKLIREVDFSAIAKEVRKVRRARVKALGTAKGESALQFHAHHEMKKPWELT